MSNAFMFLLQIWAKCVEDTGNETWVYCCDPETTKWSSQWRNLSCPHLKKVKQASSNVRSMLVILFDCEHIVCQVLLPGIQYY